MENRIPRKLKKKIKNNPFWDRETYLYETTVNKDDNTEITRFIGRYKRGVINVGFIKKADETATHTPYKIIGVENADEAEKTIRETKRKLGNGI